MKKNGNCDKNSDNFLVEFKSTSKRSIVKKKRKRKRMDGGRKREVGEDYAGGVISPFSSFRTREKEGERESEINAVTPQCCHMLFHFLPSGRREVSRRGYRVRLRETSCRDLGRRTMGVMEVTKEANSNDRATIEPPPRSIGRRHWFPPVYQLHRSFLLFFFSFSSSSSSSFFFSYSMNEPRTRWGNSLYRGKGGGGGGKRLPEIN